MSIGWGRHEGKWVKMEDNSIDELEVTEEAVKVFKDEWQKATDDRDFGNRVSRGLHAVVAYWQTEETIPFYGPGDATEREVIGEFKIDKIDDTGVYMTAKIFSESDINKYIGNADVSELSLFVDENREPKGAYSVLDSEKKRGYRDEISILDEHHTMVNHDLLQAKQNHNLVEPDPTQEKLDIDEIKQRLDSLVYPKLAEADAQLIAEEVRLKSENGTKFVYLDKDDKLQTLEVKDPHGYIYFFRKLGYIATVVALTGFFIWYAIKFG